MEFADQCSWKAGPVLAVKMKENAFCDWERVFITCNNDRIVGFATLLAKDELPTCFEYSPFIGFLFVDESFRGHRLSQLMINAAVSYARNLGYNRVYILSGEIGLYEKYGFEKIGDFDTIYGSVDQLFTKVI